MTAPVISNSITDLIGNTDLLRINSLSDLTGCEILLKCEQQNPGGSIKDRAALQLVQDAINAGGNYSPDYIDYWAYNVNVNTLVAIGNTRHRSRKKRHNNQVNVAVLKYYQRFLAPIVLAFDAEKSWLMVLTINNLILGALAKLVA